MLNRPTFGGHIIAGSALFRYLAVTTHIQITMGKSTHFIGQPLYSQVIKLLCKSKILQISEDLGGERYTKRFNVWIHLIVMLCCNQAV